MILSKEFIPLGICILLLLISGIKVLSSNYIFNSEHYICILLIVLSTIFFLTNRKVYIYLFMITLLLGSIHIIDVFYISYAFGIKDFISLNPIFIVLFILFFSTNKDSMKNYL